MTGPTILVIDDSASAAAAVCRLLGRCPEDFQTMTAPDGLEGFKLLVNGDVDLVLCDLLMDGLDGFKFLSLKSSRPELSDVPVIMLTGTGNVTEKVRALEGGAADYLTKPFDEAELVARVRVHLKVRALQRELRDKNERLRELSNTDELTRLANRRHFRQLGEIEVLRALRYGNSLSCILIDLDHFKKINDTFGHLTGDQVLRQVGQAIKRDLRQHDIAARYGGEELVLLLPQTPIEGARAVAERYRERIASLEIVSGVGPVPVSASFGVAAFAAGTPEHLDGLIGRADRALYRAKASGRNRVCWASPASDAP